MNKQFLKYYFIIIYFSLFLSLIKLYVAFLAFLKIISIIRNISVRIKINNFYKGLTYVYSYYFSYNIFCVFFILMNFSYPNLLSRFISQQLSLLLLFFQIYMGYAISQRFTPNEINTLFQRIIYILVFFGTYQFFAYNYGLPYVGLYAYDTDFGLRVSSLCSEPKYFSSILVVAIFYFIDKLKISSTNRISKYFFLILLIFLLIRAGSGNGYLAFIILLIVNIYMWKPKTFLFSFFFISISCLWFVSNYEMFNLRASHVIIIESIKNGQISFEGWDDLIVLPLMSWFEYPLFLISGFGFNLNHFFALEFMKYATWLDGNTYINGNFSIIDYISSFGIFLPMTLFVYLTIKTRKFLKGEISDELKLVVRFAYYTFVVGFFIGGNISAPFFASIGILFYYVANNTSSKNLVTIENDLNLKVI